METKFRLYQGKDYNDLLEIIRDWVLFQVKIRI